MSDTNAERLAVVVRTACADGCRWPQCRNSPDCSAVLHLSEDVIAALDGFDAARAREGVTNEVFVAAESAFLKAPGGLRDGLHAAVLAVAPMLAPRTPATHKDTLMTEDQIKHMVDRFLSWRLPEDFNPDAGISYSRPNYHPSVDATPTGTNLLNAAQADAMVRHLIDGVFSVAPRTPMPAQVTGPMVRRAREAFIGPSWQQSQHTAFIELEHRIERAIQAALAAARQEPEAPAPDPRAAASREIVEAAEDFRRHPELTGFSHPRFQRLIAALARYHGGEANRAQGDQG